MKSLYVSRKKMPRVQKLCILALCVTFIFVLADIPFLAEYMFARGITRWLTALVGSITNFLPASLYECAAVLLIAGGVALAAGLIVLLAKKSYARAARWLYRLAVAVLAVLLAFGLMYAPLYERKSAVSALGLTEISADEESVFLAAQYYIGELNALSEKLERDESGNILAACSFSELADKLNAEYNTLCDYFASYEVRPKEVGLSVAMSYLGITGIYIPFFAEANVNTDIPSYELPSTMAHEMAHAKGVSRENEANNVSYVLCIRSEDDYIRYSGLMNAAARLLNALDEDNFSVLYETLSPEIKKEYANASAHYKKYEGIIDEISSFFNDLFLKSNGVAGGTKSYGETVGSLVALYRELVGA